jgi:hypothetical protein
MQSRFSCGLVEARRIKNVCKILKLLKNLSLKYHGKTTAFAFQPEEGMSL